MAGLVQVQACDNVSVDFDNVELQQVDQDSGRYRHTSTHWPLIHPVLLQQEQAICSHKATLHTQVLGHEEISIATRAAILYSQPTVLQQLLCSWSPG